MLEASVATAAQSTKTERTVMRTTAQTCRRNFGKVCKALWPHKTAEHLAAAARCGVRTAGYYLAGERDPTPEAILAVINKMFERS